ncbi:hypothetical protein VPH35_050213 [Triticum aestivum]
MVPARRTLDRSQIVSPARERYPAGERLSSNLAVSFFSHQASPAMAATGLNTYARPYSRRSARAPTSPAKAPPFHDAGHHYPGPLPPRPFFHEHVAAPRHDHRPRGVMFDPEKMHAQVMHSFNYKHKGRAAAAGKAKGGPVTCPLLPAAPPCGSRGQRARGRSKVYVPAASAGGRERSPSPSLTRRRAWPVPPPSWAWHGRSRTTVMIRDIPNKLTRASMMKLLDDPCARVNRRRGPRAVAAASDIFYLPMDFRGAPSSMAADAARGRHYALHGRGRNRSLGNGKIINIGAAYMQGRQRLVRHFSRSTFACYTDEYLSVPRYLGRRVPLHVPAVEPVKPASSWHGCIEARL